VCSAWHVFTTVTQGAVEYEKIVKLVAEHSDDLQISPDDQQIWDSIQKGFADADSVKEKAILIERESIDGVLRFDLNTPTTIDRVSACSVL
jgi:hypothetical protein